MSDDFTIEIDYKCIIKWLESRNKLSSGWHNKLDSLKSKRNAILQEILTTTENNSIKDIIRAQPEEEWSYETVKLVLENLKKSNEGEAKTIFGGYSSKNIKQLLALEKIYIKDLLHIVDLSRRLTQIMDFDLPAISSSIDANNQQIRLYKKKITDTKSSLYNFERELNEYAQKIGINSQNNFMQEMSKKIRELPKQIDELVTKAQSSASLAESITYYKSFCTFLNPNYQKKLPYIEYLIVNGDHLIEVFNRRDDIISESLGVLNSREKRYENLFKTKKLVVQEEPQAYTINWDIELTSSGLAGQLDQNKDETPQNNLEEPLLILPFATDEPIELVTTTSPSQDFTPIEIVQSNTCEEYNCDTIITGLNSRYELLAELNELKYFLNERMTDQKNHSALSILQAYDENYMTELFQVKDVKLREYAGAVEGTLKDLLSFNLATLLSLIENPKNLDRIQERLDRLKSQIASCLVDIRGYERKVLQIEKSIDEAKKKINEKKNQSVNLKELLQNEFKTAIKKTTIITLNYNQK